jgi:hypothetical protein
MKKQREVTSNIYPAVAMLPMSSICDYPGASKCSHAVISNGKIVHACSKGYGLLKNEDFFGAFEQELRDEHINYEAVYRNVKDSQFVADYVLDGRMAIGTSKDLIQPKIRLINTYDGSGLSSGYLGHWRKVCKNGLHAMVYELDFKLRHTSKQVELAIPNVRQMLERYQQAEGIMITRRFETLAERALTLDDLQGFVHEVVDQTELFTWATSEKNPAPGKNAQTVLDTIKREAQLLDVVPNRWLVYNGLNEWLNNDQRNAKSDSVRTQLDSKIFAAVEDLN